MKKLRLDFKNRIVNMVTDNKTVIAYMEPDLEKKDFLLFLPDDLFFSCPDYVTFDFEHHVICLKQPVKPGKSSEDQTEKLKCVKRIPMPFPEMEYRKIMNTVGWEET